MVRKTVMYVLGGIVMTLVACGNPLQEDNDGEGSISFDGQAGVAYAVEYHANGAEFGRVPVAVRGYSEGEPVPLLRNYGGLARENWTFDGWNTEPDGTGTQYYIGESFSMPDHDMDLYAQWSDEERCFTMDAATGRITLYLDTACGPPGPHITVPPTVEGVIVRQIAPALFNYRDLTSVDLPDTVVEIGAYAFNGNDLTHVSLPRDLRVIGTYAFARNNNLTSIEFGESLREIHEYAFWGANPAEIALPQGIEHVGRSAFSNALGAGAESVEVPGSVRVVERGAFSQNQISTLVLHEGIELLMTGAFSWNLLTSVVVPDSVISVHRGVFGGNDITEITIGSDVEIYDEVSFGEHGGSFREYYIENGQQAGTYLFDGAEWSLE